jgi:NAD(P)-dependent dehydrogenase (short-subunit alcohol dehydrogenase family)
MRAMLDQHLWTTLHVARAVVPGMVERGWGRVIAISSTVALEGTSGMAAYAVAKAGEEALLRTLAREVAGTGVTANVLVVRKIDADHERDAAPGPKNATWATPEELVAAMMYLCSDAGSVVNGTRIPLTGRG